MADLGVVRELDGAAAPAPAYGRVTVPDVRRVVAGGGLRSVFQPVVDLDSGRVVAYEALARGPEGTALAGADALFAAARAQGVLAELDRACSAAALRGAVEAGLTAPLTLFVNLEPQVMDTAPVEDLLGLAAQASGRLRVVVEITERALAHRPAELLRTVRRVRELGWGVALDDVGADPLSLAFMPLLRPDVVKLDLRLVQQRPGSAAAQVMNAVNAYAQSTGAAVLAEGIEDERHLRMARGLGARLGQGWLLGRPAAGAATGLEVGELPLLGDPPVGDTGVASPFALLGPRDQVRRAPKSLVVELTKQLEREAMRLGDTCLVASTFQDARYFTPATASRYRDLVERTAFVCVIGRDMPDEPVPGLRGASPQPSDPVHAEWDVVVLAPHFSAALLARDLGEREDEERPFEYALTYDRGTVLAAAHSLLQHVAPRRDLPDLAPHEPPRAAAVAREQDREQDGSQAVVVAGHRTDATTPHPPVAVPEALLHRALGATTSGVTIVDMRGPDQPMIYANTAFEHLAGSPVEELLGRNLRVLQGPDTDPGRVLELREALAAGREWRGTLLNYRGPDRTPWWNEMLVAPVVDEHGRVVQYIGIQNDVTDRVDVQRALEHERDRAGSYLARMEHQARTDPLTGLANRRHLEEQVEAALDDAHDDGSAVAVVFCDLDGFKEVNDAHGHAAGDELLAVVAARLREHVRRTDLLARLGGDEFVLALTGLDRAGARTHAARVAEHLARELARPVRLAGAGATVGVRVSVGSSVSPEDGDVFGALLHRADQRMYTVKRHGRAAVAVDGVPNAPAVGPPAVVLPVPPRSPGGR